MLKEKDIRPSKFVEIAKRLRQKDIEELFLKNNKGIKKESFLKTECPSCGKMKNCNEFTKDTFIFKRCNFCNTLYVSPRPNQLMLLDYYKNSKSSEYFARKIIENTVNVRKSKIIEPRAEKVISFVNKFHIQKELIVDIGGGNGSFLEVVREKKAGFKSYLNIEPSLEGAKLSKKRDIAVINDFIENVENINACCICAFELIEHVFSPLDLCVMIRKKLKTKGLFIMTTPNIEGFDLLLLGKDSENVCAPNHLNYFNPKSIEILLKRAGFEVIDMETPGELDVDIMMNTLTNGYKLNDRFVHSLMNKNKQTLDNFQTFLQQNKLSSNMWVVAQKV